MSWIKRGILCGALIVAVAGPVFVYSLPYKQRTGNSARVWLRSLAHVRMITQGLVAHAVDQDQGVFITQDQFPRVLIELGHVDEDMLVSPVEEDDAISYIYVPGPCDFDEKQILIYEDPTHWENFVIVGFADAHTEMIDHETFERMLAEQLEAQSESP